MAFQLKSFPAIQSVITKIKFNKNTPNIIKISLLILINFPSFSEGKLFSNENI
jgi:hypothetical protein